MTRSLQAWRAASLLLGVALIWFGMASPMPSDAARPLTMHMVQHLALMSLAPPLIWMADPVRRLSIGLPPRLVVCWLSATTALVAWHVPALLILSMHSAVWRAVEHLSFLAGGLLFWWPVVQSWSSSSAERRWSIVLYLFLATLPCDVLSGFLVFSDRVVYPIHVALGHPSVSVLDDQQLAGAVMWTAVTVLYVVAAVVVATRNLWQIEAKRGVDHDVPAFRRVPNSAP